jgi:hypothetical protein
VGTDKREEEEGDEEDDEGELHRGVLLKIKSMGGYKTVGVRVDWTGAWLCYIYLTE